MANIDKEMINQNLEDDMRKLNLFQDKQYKHEEKMLLGRTFFWASILFISGCFIILVILSFRLNDLQPLLSFIGYILASFLSFLAGYKSINFLNLLSKDE